MDKIEKIINENLRSSNIVTQRNARLLSFLYSDLIEKVGKETIDEYSSLLVDLISPIIVNKAAKKPIGDAETENEFIEYLKTSGKSNKTTYDYVLRVKRYLKKPLAELTDSDFEGFEQADVDSSTKSAMRQLYVFIKKKAKTQS